MSEVTKESYEKTFACSQCGGPRSTYSAGRCRNCYTSNPVKKSASVSPLPQYSLDQEKLKSHIVEWSDEKRLTPLFLYKGTRPHRVRALWNVAYGMFLTEAKTFTAGARIFTPEGEGHLCGVHAQLQGLSLRGAFARLRGNPNLTNEVSKAFTEYVEWIHPWPCIYDPIPLVARIADHPERVAWWRQIEWKEKKKRLRQVGQNQELAPRAEIYPYIVEPTLNNDDLLFHVHRAVPSHLPNELRSDLCQDLIVAVLSGDLAVQNIPNVMPQYLAEARKMMPNRFRDVSLDDVIRGTDLTVGDTISHEHPHF